MRNTYISLMQETVGTTKAVGQLSFYVVSQINTSEQALLAGLDASTKTRQAEFEVSRTQEANQTDHENQTVRDLFVNKTSAEAVIHNTEAFIPKTDVGMLEE